MVNVATGNPTTVREIPPPARSLDTLAGDEVPSDPPKTGAQLLDVAVRHLGKVLTQFSVEADPRAPTELRQILAATILRTGGEPAEISQYDMEVREAGEEKILTTFVSMTTA